MLQKLSALVAVSAVFLVFCVGAQAQTRTPWEQHDGLEVTTTNPLGLVQFTCSPPRHGAICEYNDATIPPQGDAGWGPAPNGDTIGFSVYPSRVCQAPVSCWAYGDFTYFQSLVDLPDGFTVTQFTISFSGMDDGSRVSIFNSSYPGGLVVPGSYVFLGGSGTSDLSTYVVSGEINRVIITQVDDCCVQNNLHSAVVVLNGENVETDPDSDGDGVPDPDDVCPGYDDFADADGDGIPDGCDDCPNDADNDSDGDGVCGDVDACPGYDDNLDSDGDGVADGCDFCPFDAANDADGDGVCGDVDTCPGGDDTLDADGDGTPDFCDACPLDALNDADGDGLCADADNCPDVYNPNQIDSDGDDMGDECDPDDDNDGVPDDGDNCHYEYNPDQDDFDGDGYGDECDTDDDGDDVPDGDDQCLDTPLGEIVDDEGCAISQLCPCENNWKNHGAYVSCVAHATKDFADAGLIDDNEKGAIISVAGQSDCGHKKK